MSESNLKALIEKVSEQVVLADPENLQTIATLHTDIEAAGLLLGDQPSAVQAWATTASASLSAILLREPPDLWAALADVSRVIACMQQVIVFGRDVSEVEGRQAADVETDNAIDLTESATQDTETPAKLASIDMATDLQEPAAPVDATPEADDDKIVAPVPLTGDTDLLVDFVGESKEHLDAAEASLLILEGNATDSESINAVFRAFHTIKGVAGFLELGPVQALAHESETLLDLCRKNELVLKDDLLQLVFEAVDVMKRQVAAVELALAGNMMFQEDPAAASLIRRTKQACQKGGSKPVAPAPEKKAAPPAAPVAKAPAIAEPVVAAVKADSPPAPEPVKAPAPTVKAEHAEEPGRVSAGEGGNTIGAKVKETVRVDADRLDWLVDIIGEMVIAEAMVSQAATVDQDASDLERKLNHLDKITRELQELAMSLRMVPIRSAFQRMSRLARDLSRKMGKPVEFITAGEETELDKSVVDAIGDPLVHMVRNAIDHGIESSTAARVAAGKPEVGTVRLRAFHQGGSIFIEIEDDGRGLDRDVLLKKGREKGLIQDGANLSDQEVFELIFAPGFSTAAQITDVSGRGVGMDVVKRNIEALRGKIEITSTVGKGSVFSIRLPLTLAIIEGMVVRVGADRFIIPTLSIVRMIRPGTNDIKTVFERGEMLRTGNQLVPIYRMKQMFQTRGGEDNIQNAAVVVVEHNNKQFAIVVDELLGQQQIVIKPLGAILRQYPGFSGGAIMPDGRVGLILDIAKVPLMAENNAPTALVA